MAGKLTFSIKDFAFYRDGVKEPIEIGNIEQIRLLNAIKPGIIVSSILDIDKPAHRKFTCPVCGNQCSHSYVDNKHKTCATCGLGFFTEPDSVMIKH
jgi:hypothetical protein